MSDESQEKERNNSRLAHYRSVISDAVGELRSAEVRDSYAVITLTELLNQQLDGLTGVKRRVPSRQQRLDAVYKAFKANLSAIKATSPDTFRTHNPKDDANTEK